MITIYKLLEVDEKASKEEIEASYSRMILEYKIDPAQSAEQNEQNEKLLNKLKIAYEILTDDQKRARYDKDLATKRAEELISGVSVSKPVEEPKQEVKPEVNKDEEYDDNTENDDVSFASQRPKEDEEIEEVVEEKPVLDVDEVIKETDRKLDELTKEEQKKIQKAAQEEFKANLKRAQQAEQEYNEAYNKAYNDYLKKNGYKVKEEYSKLKQIRNIAIVIVVLILVAIIAWLIPPVRTKLISLYEENIIIKALIDILIALLDAIFSAFK